MFWLTLIVLMLLVAASPGISIYLETRRAHTVGEPRDSVAEHRS